MAVLFFTLLSERHNHSGDFLLLCHLNHSYIINTTQFLLLQAHLQTYLLQYLMKLMVLFMHQLQLIGIKTNLESFVTTTLMEHMLNRHQLHLFLWVSKQWGYYTAAVGAIYTDVTTPVSFSRCFFAASIDILLAASTTWPGTTQTVWNINASTANKLRFIWAKAPIELDGAVWFGIFIQTVGIFKFNRSYFPYRFQRVLCRCK